MLNLELAQLLKSFSAFKQGTELEEKLVDINYPLEQYLQNEEAIQCYKDIKKNAKKYFDKNKIKQLIKYITVEPKNDDYLKGHKYPYVASEMLKSECDFIQDLFVLTEEEYNEKYKDEISESSIENKNNNNNESEKEDPKDEDTVNIYDNDVKDEKKKEKNQNEKNIFENTDKNTDKEKYNNVEDYKSKENELENEISNNINNEERTKKIEKNMIIENENKNLNIINTEENEKDKDKKYINENEEKKEEKKEKQIINNNNDNDNEILNEKEKKEEKKEKVDNNIENNYLIREDIRNEEKEENKEEKKEEKKEENKGEKKGENKVINISKNELLDLLLNFVISDKPQLNDVLCGYFSNILISLIDKYPIRFLAYLYSIRKDALKQIVLRSYQKSLSILSLKLLKLEDFLNKILEEIKNNKNKLDLPSILKILENSYLYRNELFNQIILSINLDGIQDEKGNIIKNIDIESIFSILYNLVNEKIILTNIINNSKIYNHIFEILEKKVFVKEEKDKNKKYIYKLFIILITKIFSGLNKVNKIKEEFDITKNFDFNFIKENKTSLTFLEKFIISFLSILIFNFSDNSTLENSNTDNNNGLGIHNIYIMDMIFEVFNGVKKIPLIFDNILIITKFIQKSIDYFFKYPLNNIYHFKFIKLFKLYLDNEQEHHLLTEHLFNDLKFHEILVDYINKDEPKKREINNEDIIKNKDDNKNEIKDKNKDDKKIENKVDNIEQKNNIEKKEENKNDNKGQNVNKEKNRKDNEDLIIKNDYSNKFYYKSGKTIKSCLYPYIIDLIYKIQAKSGLKTFEEKEKTDLSIKNIGEFEFIKDETSSKDVIEIKTSSRLKEILKTSNKWMDTVEKIILPIIRIYEGKLFFKESIQLNTIPKTSLNNNLLHSFFNIISSKNKLLNKIEINTSINININKKYNDVNFWKTNISIPKELKNKINTNNLKSTNNKENEADIEHKNEENKIIDDEEDELLGIAIKMEKKEKMENFKIIPKINNLKPQLKSQNFKCEISNNSALITNKNENNNKKNNINENKQEKNNEYNDINYWKINTESLLNKKEIESLLDDL